MEATVGVLFNGSASSIKTQIFIILDQLIAGDGETPPLEGEETSTALQASITKVAFVFAISIWSGFQGKGKKGNINFRVGSQDIIDIISHSIEKFARSGKVGAKGRMSCKGTVGQDVEKGLY
ncbi:uncharacterized protein ATNIH1004_004724 [Aspergillus tanneri]|uniref:Ecp2 effector protein-like domain-containing protein n=1 Tax=Aspergillus tanneri TaxID=1220188 RepID=A0A5M9MPL0_9EURO|nr:uncharacterized protein ATNIH1004_004724 [Aspergillus tanneri]KAA8648838.1 hypothetical protein ATNIH1004_004724 [Aspergillus tanneri]